MDHQEKTVLLKNGKPCLLRQAEESDAEMLVEYLKTTSGETPYMVREPEEVRISVEEEVEFIRKNGRTPGPCTCWRLRTVCSRAAAPLPGTRSGSGCGTGVRWGSPCTAPSGAWASGLSCWGRFWTLPGPWDMSRRSWRWSPPTRRLSGCIKSLVSRSRGLSPRAFRYRDGSYADFLFMVKDLT